MLSCKRILEAWSDYIYFVDKEMEVIQNQGLMFSPCHLLTFYFHNREYVRNVGERKLISLPDFDSDSCLEVKFK